MLQLANGEKGVLSHENNNNDNENSNIYNARTIGEGECD